jgi:hypothetical protein
MVSLRIVVVTFLTRVKYIPGNYTIQSHHCNISNIDLHNGTIRMIRCNIPECIAIIHDMHTTKGVG